MPLLSLEVGLVVRHGARRLEFVRILPGHRVQFEDQLTREVQNMRLNRFYTAVLAKQLIPILADEPATANLKSHDEPPVFIADLGSLDEREQQALERRLAYVRAMRKRGIRRGQRDKVQEAIPAVAATLKDDRPPSDSTVMSWMRDYELSCSNAASLVSGNTHRRRARRTCQLIEDIITKKLRSVYLTRARHTLKHTFHQIVWEVEKKVERGEIKREEAGVSLSTVQRRLAEIRPYDRDKARYGENYARHQFRTSVEGVQATRPLERLECDHTLLNWVVICDRTGLPLGRPTITIVIDSYNGYVVGLYVSFYGPGLTSVLNVIKCAILPKDDYVIAAGAKRPWIAFGIGETIVLDNGLEFHSPQFRLAAWELAVDIEYCRVRTPWLKPKVERFFLELDYLTLTRGRVRKPLANVEKIDPSTDAAITFSDLVSGLIRFVVDVYPFQQNSRTLDLPFNLYSEGIEKLPPALFPTSFDQLDLIAAMSQQVTVRAGEVGFRGLAYGSTELRLLKGDVAPSFKTLVKWNPDDLSNLYVQHPLNKHWLMVPSIRPEYTTGLSWVQHLLVRKHKRKRHIEGSEDKAQMQALRELHEFWGDALAASKRKVNPKTAALLSGMSSSAVVKPTQENAVQPSKVFCPEDIVATAEEEIPEFDSFVMS